MPITKSKLLCPTCKVSLASLDKVHYCPKCGYHVTKSMVEVAKRRKQLLTNIKVTSPSKKEMQVMQSGILSKGHLRDDLVCPLCKTKSVQQVDDKRTYCCHCLLPVTGHTTIGVLYRDKILEMHSEGYSTSQISYELIIPCSTVRSVIKSAKQQKSLGNLNKYVCPFCETGMRKALNYFMCPKCHYSIPEYYLVKARKKLESMTNPRRSWDRYNKVFAIGVSQQEQTNYTCPVCKTKTVHKTEDGRYVCRQCLLNLYPKRRISQKLKEKVRHLYDQDWTLAEIVKECCLGPTTVYAILFRYQLKKLQVLEDLTIDKSLQTT